MCFWIICGDDERDNNPALSIDVRYYMYKWFGIGNPPTPKSSFDDTDENERQQRGVRKSSGQAYQSINDGLTAANSADHANTNVNANASANANPYPSLKNANQNAAQMGHHSGSPGGDGEEDGDADADADGGDPAQYRRRSSDPAHQFIPPSED